MLLIATVDGSVSVRKIPERELKVIFIIDLLKLKPLEPVSVRKIPERELKATASIRYC